MSNVNSFFKILKYFSICLIGNKAMFPLLTRQHTSYSDLIWKFCEFNVDALPGVYLAPRRVSSDMLPFDGDFAESDAIRSINST